MGLSPGRTRTPAFQIRGFGVPKHKSHLSIYPEAAILCGFDRLMQTHFFFFLLARTLGKDFDTFLQPGRCKGWMGVGMKYGFECDALVFLIYRIVS